MGELKVGDTVFLKSGSPEMTVEEILGDGRIVCVWFDGSKRNASVFAAGTLTKEDTSGLGVV